jgi:hypothetical protein
VTTLPRSNVTAQFIFLDTMRTFITFAPALAIARRVRWLNLSPAL